jgi:hypothetical protein
MDFLEAISKRSVSILLNGEGLEVRRANLGLHYRLSVVLDQWQEARRNHHHKQASELTIGYIALATGLDTDTVRQASVSEILFAYTVLVSLNRAMDALPFMLIEKSKAEYGYEYQHRGLANWVAEIAARYGWTADYILDELSPEEAACYLQEAIIQEYDDKEFMYKLSEVAYKMEGKGKSAKSRYIPFPKPSWMAQKAPKLLIRKTWYPQGNVIDSSNFGKPTGNA